jgi:roadblock/LC7 domain-containing protein
MATVDQVMKVKGVLAAGQFAPDGRLMSYKSNMPMDNKLAEMSAQFCGTVTMLFNTMAGAFSQLSKMNWVPQKGWMYAGGDYTVAVGGNIGVFAETSKVDFNELYRALTT